MNKFIKFFFGLDLFAGLTLITTFISKMLLKNDTVLFITVAIIFSIVNLIISIILAKKFNFYKNVSEYVKK